MKLEMLTNKKLKYKVDNHQIIIITFIRSQ